MKAQGASFSLSGRTQPSIEEGNGSRSPEKTRVYGQKTIREGMQWLHERSAQDLSRHDSMSWMDLVHQLGVRTPGPPSGRPVVVMVQPTHDRNGNHLVPRNLSVRNRSEPFRNLLSNPLMGSCLIEVGHIRLEHALELLLLKDQQMV